MALMALALVHFTRKKSLVLLNFSELLFWKKQLLTSYWIKTTHRQSSHYLKGFRFKRECSLPHHPAHLSQGPGDNRKKRTSYCWLSLK